MANQHNRFRTSNQHDKQADHACNSTPVEATQGLLKFESFDGDIWDPACGDGAISKVLLQAGYDIVSTDQIDHGFGTPNHNFLTSDKPLAKNIICRPPFGRGVTEEFIDKALTHSFSTEGKVAILCNSASPLYPMTTLKFVETPPSAVYVVDKLICNPNDGSYPRSGPRTAHRYCWFVWRPDEEPCLSPEICWISAK